MPVMLGQADFEPWLEAVVEDPQRLRDLLVPYGDSDIEAKPCWKAVGNHRAEGPALVEALSQLPGTGTGNAQPQMRGG